MNIEIEYMFEEEFYNTEDATSIFHLLRLLEQKFKVRLTLLGQVSSGEELANMKVIKDKVLGKLCNVINWTGKSFYIMEQDGKDFYVCAIDKLLKRYKLKKGLQWRVVDGE